MAKTIIMINFVGISYNVKLFRIINIPNIFTYSNHIIEKTKNLNT